LGEIGAPVPVTVDTAVGALTADATVGVADDKPILDHVCVGTGTAGIECITVDGIVEGVADDAAIKADGVVRIRN